MNKFIEAQKFNQWWLWLIIFGLMMVPVFSFLTQGNSVAVKTSPLLLTAVLFWMLKLKTRVDHNGINMVYFPFVSKFIEWDQIKKVSVINYGFIGGWGIRFWTQYGTVYNVRGNKGLLIELNEGKTFVIGTQKEQELALVLKELGKISE